MQSSAMLFLKLIVLIPAFILLLIASPFLYILCQILVARWRYRNIPSPKVKSLILGHAQDFIDMDANGWHYSMLILDWKKQLGSVFVLFFVNRVTVICLEPYVVKELLVSSDSGKPKAFYSNAKYLFGQRFLGDGVFSQLNDSKWAQQRKSLNPAFKRRYLMGLMRQYNDSCDQLKAHLKAKADGKTEVLMAKELGKVSSDIIAKVAFGMDDLNIISDGDTPFSVATSKCFTGVAMQQKLSFFGRIDPRSKARAERAVAQGMTKLMRDLGKECITKRFQAMQDGSEYPHDILTHILQSYVSSQEIKENEMALMIDEFMTFYAAGQETTSHLMSFTLEFVGRHPEIYQKIQEEVDSVIGERESITYDDTAKLEYLTLVLKETLRIAPPVVALQRINAEELTVNGVKIPAGSDIELNTFALSRDERFWEEPEKFDPERFRNDTIRNLYAYFPFALGPRICIGQHFAMIEAKAILAKLFQTFTFTLVPGYELSYCFEVTLKPLHNTPVYLTRRKDL